ncbi:TBC1 domain family member 1 isoform X2 [Anoplophora glabripennis]|uniref:TBC1 domain family member 1 isoform X2 n=1 Tax=Anoplophora glabripennis TaxID=217634 RepID=UPI0008735C96|nr:TBC1 domain family member 1 isoform X2 [Anoplophora glabripennis]
MITIPLGLHSPLISSHSDASYIEKKAVTDLYKQMKEQNHATPTRSISSAANLTSLCVDISPSSSNFFEVLYIGKIKVWQKKVPETFIDDALEKFKAHELEKNRLRQLSNIGRLQSEDNIVRRGSADSSTSEDSLSISAPSVPPLLRSQSAHSNLLIKPLDVSRKLPERIESEAISQPESEQEKTNAQSTSNSSDESTSSQRDVRQPKDAKTSVNIDDHNRTMVLQVDRTDLRLISPDRKVILLHKHHKDVTTCVQGQIRAEHFGFICKEGNTSQTYMAFIFKCESPSIASDACAAITQAFLSAESRPRNSLTSCEHCPMVWYHKLCVEIEHMSDRKTQAAILRRLEQLDEEEQSIILTKFRGAETDSVREQNEFLMMLLRAHCEMKQGRHVHDTAENRSEFLNQYLGSSTIFTKAKRSLTNSFDQLLKRKGSRDDFGSTLKGMNLPITNNLNRESSPHSPVPSIADISDKESEGTRSRSSTIGSQSDLKDHLSIREQGHKGSVSPDRSIGSEKGVKSPMMDIFLKVGNSPKSITSEEGSPNKLDAGSWRQAIFKRVMTPNKQEKVEEPTRNRTKEELRILWKKSIYQAILLVRMEKENARIRAKQEESAVKRIKLEYDEMKPTQREVMDVWEMVTNKDVGRVKCDKQMLLHAIRQGVPRGKRGDVWQFLAEQFCAKIPPIDTTKYPNYNTPYETLLRQLTSHQHAILIDLGRTFPNHSYFSSPLGPGQLALFNLLKAYSLLDPEVGYCQGLSFVAGVLLLHMEESQAFFVLRHLMYRRGLRKQYLPDMMCLQIKLYQLSRLVHDQLSDLYNHFDFYEVAPTLYAAPWLLTVFASQFPLGFVTRVFDLMFLEGPDVIFRVALALLSYHRDKLLLCDSFEEIMNYIKVQIPNIDKPILDKIMKQVYTTDITKQLEEYKVEYQVLQEEMSSVQPQVEALHKMEAQNKTLTEQNKALMSQLELALANVQRLEKTRVLLQSQLNRLEMQSRAQDVTIATLGNFINNLVEQKVDVEIPDDVRRILSQITFTERRKSEFKPQQNNLMKMFQKASETLPDNKVMVKSLSTGKISIPNIVDQNMFRTNSLNAHAVNNPELKTQSQSNSTEKMSKFFSSSHNNILQQRLNAQNTVNSTMSCGAKIDIKIQDVENEPSTKNVANEKPVSLPLDFDTSKVSPTNSSDSGVDTPLSPKTISHHPLSNCDVTFTYNGTRELKNIRSIRNLSRNSSPDIIGK